MEIYCDNIVDPRRILFEFKRLIIDVGQNHSVKILVSCTSPEQ